MSTLRVISSRQGSGGVVEVMLVATFLLVASSVSAQVPADSAVRAFFEPIEVPLVNIDVFVTDADGRAVPGLTLDDFEVLEDGLPVEITHFAAASRSPVHSTNHETQPEATEQTGRELNLVVFLDENGIALRQRRATVDHLRDFLSMELPATLRLMLVNYAGRAAVRVPLTDDPARVVSALDEMDRASRPHLDGERDRILRDVLNTAGEVASVARSQSSAVGLSTDGSLDGRRTGGRQSTEQRRLEELADEARRYVSTIRAYAMSQRQRIESLLGELETLVRLLSVVHGQNAILLVGGGLEARPGEDLFLAWERAFPEVARQMNVSATYEARKNDVGPRIQRLVGTANRHRVSFYTLSGPVRVASGISAEGPGLTEGRDLARALADRDPLLAVSRATGGRSLVSSPGLAAQLGEVVHEIGSCYSVGYSPGHPAEGRYHALTVRLRREGFGVRHREGYVHSPSADRIVDRTIAAAVLGVTDNPLDVSVEAQEVGPPQADDEYLVPVLVKVPIARLMLRPESDRHTGQITAMVVVHGADGLSDPQSWRYPINVTNDRMMEALGSQAGMVLHLLMGKGPQRIAVGVRDDVAGNEAAATLDIDLPPPSSKSVLDGES